MKSVFFIRTNDNRPYILVTVLSGGTEFQPLTGDADDVARALGEAYNKRPIKKNELDGALDDDLSIEGPLVINRDSRKLIASFLEEANIPKYEEGTKPPVVSGKVGYSSDIADVALDSFPKEVRKNAIEYKALAFVADQTKTTFNYEVKRVRALWDPTLSIPGTNRRGGWRCPTGTRYGGQITDRFGRNCGWGVARRIANAITNIGERLEDVDDRRRGRRVNRRNERMAARLRGDAREGRLEGAARRVAERLEGDDTAPSTPQAGSGRERPDWMPDWADESYNPLYQRMFGRGRGTETAEETPTPTRHVRRRRTNLRDSERRRMEREVQEPNAPRTEDEQEQRQPRPQRAPRRRGQAVNQDETASDIGDAPRAGESYDDYINRKYSEYKARVEDIQRRGGQAGLLTRDEWYKFNRNNLRETWGRANGGEIPNEENVAPRPQRQPRPRAPRRRRVNASNAQAAETANRRPRPEDQPIPQSRPNVRPTRVRAVDANEDIDTQKRNAIRNIPADATAAERREYRDYVNQFDPAEDGAGVPVLMQFGEWREFNNQVRRANGQRPLGPRKQRRPQNPPEPPAAPEPDLGGSIPDARSERNVYNQFRENGLPDTAYWRQQDFPEGEVRAELERRFGRYYDNNNQRNARGDYVNSMIRRRGQQPAPQGVPPQPPAPQPQAQPQFQLPSQPPQPPQAPARPQGPVRRRRRNANATEPVDTEAIASARVRNSGRKNLASRNDAVQYLHQGNGNLADVPDGVVVDAVIDDELKDVPGGRDMNPNDIVKNGFGGVGAQYENRRYKFEVVKNTSGRSYRWNVTKVTDKNTGEVWFMKSSGYGQNDGLLENIGMHAAQALQFPNDENHLRIGNPADDRSGRATRWMMMRSIDQWNHGNAQYGGRKWKEIERIAPAEKAQIYEGDAARIAVLDFIFDNQDRHRRNFMFNVDQRGRTRLGLIDHGLLFGGRIGEGGARDATPAQLRAKADAIVASPGVNVYRAAANNGILGLGSVYRHRDQQSRQRFAATVRRSVEKLEKDLDTILSKQRIEANGAKMTRLEVAHLEQMTRVARARIEWLKNNQEDLVRLFG